MCRLIAGHPFQARHMGFVFRVPALPSVAWHSPNACSCHQSIFSPAQCVPKTQGGGGEATQEHLEEPERKWNY